MTHRVLVVGARGQVGTELCRQTWPSGLEVLALGRPELDLTDHDSIREVVDRHAPAIVINAAAYTAVDRAESEPELAAAVNSEGVAELASACSDAGIPLVHLSTDYVFDGRTGRAWREDDRPDPKTVYGRTKLAGENAVRARLARHLVLRTSWVFAGHGRNFVRTMLQLGQSREVLNVVDDQIGCPTPAAEIARLIVVIVSRYAAGDPIPWGLYHMAGTPPASWHGFATEIFSVAGEMTPLSLTELNPIGSEAYPTPAPRPANSVLDSALFESCFGLVPPDWRAGLMPAIRELLDNQD